MPDAVRSSGPIFILGILPRNGTNFLSDLFRPHPNCAVPAPIWEDFLLHHADLLVHYANMTCRHWRRWGDEEEFIGMLCQQLGDGLLAFLNSRVGENRLVTKMPSVWNLGHFFRLFPQAYLLIIVHDGCSVVESFVKTFGGNFEGTARRWAKSAKVILDFDEVKRHSCNRYLIVKYEELWIDIEGELRKIFAFVGLDNTIYNFGHTMTCL